MTIFLIAAIPGPKLYNGMICGLAEAFASILFALLLSWMTDIQASILCALTCASCNILYNVLGAGAGGIPAMIMLGLAIVGIGGLVNAVYIVIEMRVPPEQLGASIVIVMTFTVFCSGFAPNLAFLP